MDKSRCVTRLVPAIIVSPEMVSRNGADWFLSLLCLYSPMRRKVRQERENKRIRKATTTTTRTTTMVVVKKEERRKGGGGEKEEEEEEEEEEQEEVGTGKEERRKGANCSRMSTEKV